MTYRDKWQPKRNRSAVEIVADILRLLRLGNTGRIQITHYAHLNRKQATSYVDDLLEAGLLEGAEEEMGLPSYRITRKGLAALSLIENIREMLPPEGTTDILHRSKIMGIDIGQVFITKRVAELTRENKEFALFVQKSLQQYRKGDWEDKGDEGRQLNSPFLESGMRLFSSYGSGQFPEIWITTKPDRSSSTIMFPDEDVSIEPQEHYVSGEGVESKEPKRARG